MFDVMMAVFLLVGEDEENVKVHHQFIIAFKCKEMMQSRNLMLT